jgi:hypothetical protein
VERHSTDLTYRIKLAAPAANAGTDFTGPAGLLRR